MAAFNGSHNGIPARPMFSPPACPSCGAPVAPGFKFTGHLDQRMPCCGSVLEDFQVAQLQSELRVARRELRRGER